MRSGCVNRIVGLGWLAARDFWRARRAAVALGTAIAVPVLVFAFAGLIEIVHSTYVSDSMSRAARAAARAIALTPHTEAGAGALDAVACIAIRRELRLADGFDCAANWTLTVDTDLTPAALLGEGNADGGGAAGDMVVVRIAWNQEPWEFGQLIASLDEENEEPRRSIAVGVARREPGIGS